VLCCKVYRFVVNVRNTHSGLYTKYIVIRAYMYIYLYTSTWRCVHIYTSGLPCAHTDTRDALEIHSWKTFYLLTLCKEIFLKEIIVCIKKSPPSCVYILFPGVLRHGSVRVDLAVQCGHRGLGLNTCGSAGSSLRRKL